VISFVKPMEADIPNWYIVETKEQMIETAVTLLNDNSVQYYSQTVYKMEDTVAEMVKLFE
jgi:phage I-like protein